MVGAEGAAQSHGLLRTRVSMLIGTLAGIVLYLVLSIVAGLFVFSVRFADAG